MTFIELLNELNNKYGKEYENIFFEMISFLSLNYKTKSDIITSIRKEIDFSKKEIEKICNKFFIKKIPIEHIVNKTEFMGLDLYINKNVLIPRKETEYLVEIIASCIDNNKPIKVLDLCCGSGAIGLSIKNIFKNSDVTLVDKYKGPISISLYNKSKTGLDVRVIKNDLFKFWKNNNEYNVIISNPPYIKKGFALDGYVRKEPKEALFANDNGLEIIKFIITKYYNLIKENGMMFIEFGFDQKDEIEEFVKGKFKYEFIKDQFDIYRYIKIIKE